MRASHSLSGVSVSCDEPNLEQGVRLARHGANGGTKALTVIGSMLLAGFGRRHRAVAGGRDHRAVRSASRTVDDRIVAARVQVVQRARVDAVTREPLAWLWAAGAGPVDPAGPLTFDLDSTICPVYGRAKQGAGFGYAQRRPPARTKASGATTEAPVPLRPDAAIAS